MIYRWYSGVWKPKSVSMEKKLKAKSLQKSNDLLKGHLFCQLDNRISEEANKRA